MDQNRMPLVEALQQFREEAPAYFRIPGHRFERGLDETLNGASLAAYDLSEAEGLDDLHHAEGVIAEAQKLAAETWKAKKTFFLVNGTTCGNEAMVLSSVKEGEKIIVPRNVHKSVLMGLILSGATPVYVMPEYSTKWQMWGGVTPETIEKAFAETPDAKAVLLVSPTVFAVICRRSQKSVTATTQRFLSMKHMDRTSIFPNSFLSAHWKVVRMPARRVSTKRRVPLHRAPSYHSVLAVSMRQEWPPICRWYRVHRRPTF